MLVYKYESIYITLIIDDSIICVICTGKEPSRSYINRYFISVYEHSFSQTLSLQILHLKIIEECGCSKRCNSKKNTMPE